MSLAKTAASRPKVCFLYIAQTHQILHSLPIAVALARGWPGLEVEIAATTQDHLDYARQLLDALGGAPIASRLLPPAWLRAVRLKEASTPPKALMLAANAMALGKMDAIVTPERTTAMLRKLGVRKPLLVYTQHGAGDRGGVFEPRLRQFDLVMAAGPKQRQRMVEGGWVKPENCAMVGYPKFDIIDALPGSPLPVFPDAKPIVVYNPHFHATLGSWPRFGVRVLEQFAADGRFNLIFAPHIRLFDGASQAMLESVAPFRDHPRIHIDLGGPAAIDMTYTRAADIYLGDVSSQIYEFLRTPKPCLFLNPGDVSWQGDESFHHWQYGPVLTSIDGLTDAVEAARVGHADYVTIQKTGFAESFDLTATPSSERAARAIAERVLAKARQAA
ncbi:glycerophosphotransferase [Caulobacter sp. DWR1-3-2b1]|uniref:glycerophosphotransferase n=1 Tax=Caulobacter sp. DWR1-3-2b1 TaxID=2804670 RepID=UPI003CF10EDF